MTKAKYGRESKCVFFVCRNYVTQLFYCGLFHPMRQRVPRTHVIHPSLILFDGSSERSGCVRLTREGMDRHVAALVSPRISLDVPNAAAALPSSSNAKPHSRNGETTVDFALPSRACWVLLIQERCPRPSRGYDSNNTHRKGKRSQLQLSCWTYFQVTNINLPHLPHS